MSKKKQIEEMFNIIVDGVIDGEENNGVPTGNTCANIAEALYNAGYRKQEWISVEERLPELNGDVRTWGELKIQPSVRVLCVCKQKSGKVFVKEGFYELWGSRVVWKIPGSIYSVTHWMPLPEPPKMKGGAE